MPVTTPLYNNKYIGLNGNLAKSKVNSSIGQFEAQLAAAKAFNSSISVNKSIEYKSARPSNKNS